VQGDPVNYNDPSGNTACFIDGIPTSCGVIAPEFGMYDCFSGMGPDGFVSTPGTFCPAFAVPASPAPTKDPELKCSFSGSTTPAPGKGTVDNSTVEGYYVPMTFTFTASGGNGTYTWNSKDAQTVTYSGSVTYQRGDRETTINMGIFPPHKETPSYTISGSSIKYFDSPGLTWTSRFGNLMSGNPTWNGTLQVTVSSGDQTVKCPTVYWQVREIWEPGFNVSGSATIQLRPF
jgi:hypothetical protein